MNTLSEYEKQRQINLRENQKMLESLGLLKPFRNILPMKKPVLNGNLQKRIKKRKRESPQNCENVTSQANIIQPDYTKVLRRSNRVKGIQPDVTILVDQEDVDEEKKCATQRHHYSMKRENIFGNIQDVPVGTVWLTRIDCSRDGVHRPTVAGIHGSETEGCYSIALSGGYEDDIDLGDSFTYTGEGGRDLKGTKANPKNLRTAPQSKNQTLTKGNLALSRNVENRRPVRVIRGYKLPGSFAPEEGYRYDGLYTVEKYWEAVGLSGFLVYKFIFTRCPNQEPAPWATVYTDHNENEYVENCNNTLNPIE